MTAINPLTPSDDAAAAQTLVSAFHDDPIMNWVSSAPGFLPLLFGLGVPVFREQGISYMSTQGQGVALWMGPRHVAQWPLTLSSLRRFIKAAGWRALGRSLLLHIKVHRAHPTDPHYYLFAIGIKPDAAGQGAGSALIAHMLERCDREGMPAYLENSNPRNLPFYRKLGFRVLHEVRPTRSSPALWLMWRDP